MLFDTDVLIWYLRGDITAAKLLQSTESRYISVVVYMELLQGARNKNEMKAIRAFLKEAAFEILPLTENIGHRASIYMEQYSLKFGICMADALLASTAAENQITLCTGNRKHYKAITEIDLKVFRP